MAEYLIQGETLDDIADAINAKTGGTSAMTPAQMVTAIGSISGSGWDTVSIARNLAPSGRVSFYDTITIEQGALARKPITSLFAPNASVSYGGMSTCTLLETAVLLSALSTSQFAGCTSLRAVDQLGGNVSGAEFQGCTNLKTLILRQTVVSSIANLNAISGTPFASDGSGGTLYVPSALISSYQSATNWSTVLGYPNNRILPLEGSAYENAYVDGTPINHSRGMLK